MTHSAMTVPVLRAMLIGVIAQHVNVHMATRILHVFYVKPLMVRYEDEGEGARGRGEGTITACYCHVTTEYDCSKSVSVYI